MDIGWGGGLQVADQESENSNGMNIHAEMYGMETESQWYHNKIKWRINKRLTFKKIGNLENTQ